MRSVPRRLATLAPASWWRLAARTVDRRSVSVLVLVTDDNAVFLADCLSGLSRQSRRPVEVLLLVVGRGRDTADLVGREVAHGGWRLRVLRLPGGAPPQAYDEGVAAARGRFLLLITAGDLLAPAALDQLVAADADLAGGPGPVPTAPVLYRRAFWREAGLVVSDGPDEFFQPQATAILAGGRAAAVSGPLVVAPRRGTGRGFASQPVLAPQVPAWAEAVAGVRGALGPDFDAWLLASEAPRFLADAERCTPEQWRLLTELVRALATPERMALAPVEDRVRLHLATQDRQDDLARFNVARWQESEFPVRVLGADAFAELPVTGVPEDALALHGDQARAVPRTVPRPTASPAGPAALHRQWYAEADHVVDPELVYFQSYHGAVTDSPLAIHRELRRRRPELRTVWAVRAADTAPPDGGEPVVIGSRGWYAALASAGRLVVNVDLEKWFVKRPGQRLLQTYHGYPSKAMGQLAWSAKGFTPMQVERLLRRTSGTWDLLVTPGPEMDRHYREQYRYDGPILAAGYPRDDDLVGPRRDEIRAQVRAQLGIGNKTAVLYAPTWRDDLTTNFRAARMSTVFDVDAAAAALGDRYVLLVRGHRFHRRRPDVQASDHVLDVSDHPEINELVLAADAAVFDYSSLRFDFSLTGRPMVFLVPDLDRYAGSTRGFLYDFPSSAPGPLVADTAAVVAELRDLETLTRRYADDYARFSARFNRLQDGRAAERVVAAFFADNMSAP